MIDRKKIGKQNRIKGLHFENFARKDLEEKGWIVLKNPNNVGLWDKKGNKVVKKNGKYIIQKTNKEIKFEEIIFDKFVQGKPKFNPFTKMLMMNSGGFPDFIAYKILTKIYNRTYEIIGCECKSNGYLNKEEKGKCSWLLKNNIFSKIFVAKKSKQGRKVIAEYKEFDK